MTVSRRRFRGGLACAAAVVLTLASCADRVPSAPDAATGRTAAPAPPRTTAPPSPPIGDLPPVAALIEQAVAEPRMPGAVVQIGHGGEIVFRRAFGVRKLAGEPGLDGAPTPAEPMTVDTVFDLASLTKSLATATAVLQLYEHGKVGIDEPLQTYLPEFNPGDDPRRAEVTLRMVLTHTSGLAGDLAMTGPWGLQRADKAEGLRRALGTPLAFPPGAVFHYSDIGFILLGALIEKVTGQPEDVYTRRNVFEPLRMTDTRYLPAAKACGPHRVLGNALAVDPSMKEGDCPEDGWDTAVLRRVAPTARDEDSRDDPRLNPDFDRLLRGTVHDPTARRMGGVAGSAGLFSTVRDLGLFAQALLDRRAGRPSAFPLTRDTVVMMTTPQQPGHHPGQTAAAEAATRAAGPNRSDPMLAASYPAIPGQDLRGLGWDIDTVFSSPRGLLFPIGSFGHAGFTGTSLWIDPDSQTYIVLLANVIHQRGGPPIAKLAGHVSTAAARALGLYSG